MHEVGIMQSTLELAEGQALAAGATCIEEVRMRVGRMTGVVPEALQHAFEALKPGTLAQEARLEVEYVPGAFWCAGCDREFEADAMYTPCPTCGEPSLGMRRWTEIQLVSLEVS